MQLTDIHFGHSPTGEKDLETQALIRNILEWEEPDLVAVTGDVISGNKWDKVTKGWAEGQYRKLTDVLTEKR